MSHLQANNANLITILGAQKAGTTTLFDILARHPEVEPCTRKEPAYFNYTKKYNPQLNQYLSWFRHHDRPYLLDATPGYLYGELVPQRISQMFPRAKLIILLRDPVDRAYSAWNMFRTMNQGDPAAIWQDYFELADTAIQESMRPLLFAKQFPDFRALVDLELSIMASGDAKPEPSIVRRGLYAAQIEHYLHFFSPNQFFVADQTLFFSDLENSLRRLARFLELDTQSFLDSTIEEKSILNKGDYRQGTVPDAETCQVLKEFFNIDARNLRDRILPSLNREFIIYPGFEPFGDFR